MYQPIIFNDVSLSFSNKICFEDFSTKVYPYSRIAIIGRNGSGKSSLLKIIKKTLLPSSGEINFPDDLNIGYVEQTISDFENLSGGQKLNKKLTEALAKSPDILLLDEPTNHLDLANRKSLMRMLQGYQGTLIIVSHDTELLRNCVDTIWHLEDNKIKEFTGSYDNYIHDIKKKRNELERELSLLKREKKDMHTQLMKEQSRASKSKEKGKKSISNKKWPTVVSNAKAGRAEQTSGKKKSAIDKRKHNISEQLSELRLPEIILPKFSLDSSNNSLSDVLSISRANIGYTQDNLIIKDFSLSMASKERIAIKGNNASGKSTLLKAILNNKNIIKSGDWYIPRNNNIGYLEQHYNNLDSDRSVYDHVKEIRSDWSEQEVRKHLNDFLFRKNEEVYNAVANLSGGEKARLSLSLISAKTPELLILDEVTNNLDLETKEHVIQVLKEYPGAMIIVSHEDEFIDSIGVDSTYKVENGMFYKR